MVVREVHLLTLVIESPRLMDNYLMISTNSSNSPELLSSSCPSTFRTCLEIQVNVRDQDAFCQRASS